MKNKIKYLTIGIILTLLSTNFLISKETKTKNQTPTSNKDLASHLKFETINLSLKYYEGAKQLPFQFKFQNTSDKVIKIKKVGSSCSCTVAKLDKIIYNPNETGLINGTMKVKGSSGRTITQKVYVNYIIENNLKDVHNKTLTVTAKIPSLYEITPRKITWKNGDTSEKTINVKFNTKEQVTINLNKTPQQRAKNIEANINTITKGREYSITVKPKINESFSEFLKFNTSHNSFPTISVFTNLRKRK